MSEDVYQKTYKMRQQGEGGQNVVVSIPPEIIEKEARKRGLTIESFIKTFRVVAQFNGFEGVMYKFIQAEE